VSNCYLSITILQASDRVEFGIMWTTEFSVYL
jgi:hypothetical protein